MDFGLSEEQLLLVETVDRFLAEHCPLDFVREAVDEHPAKAKALDAELTALGIMPLTIPEAQGGSGLGLLDAALVQECLGRYVAPVPFASQVIAALAIRDAGNAALADAWLPRLAAGEVRFALALKERHGAREQGGLEATGSADTDARLSGKTLFVVDLPSATHLLAAARDGGIYIVDLNDSGVGSQALQTIDRTRCFHEVTLADVPATPLPSVSAGPLLRAERVLLAADSLGAASAMLAQAVDYAGQREQFGRVIASFQAVKHLCADMAARLEPCRALVWYAAHAIDGDQDDADLMAVLAKSHLAEVGQFVARTATEVHGGMGFTDLLGLHYWFKRIGANRQLGGTPERLREEAARLQGWI